MHLVGILFPHTNDDERLKSHQIYIHSSCVMHIAFPLQQQLHERSSVSRYTVTACLVILYIVYFFSPRIKIISGFVLTFVVNTTQLPTCCLIDTWSTVIRTVLVYVMGLVDILICRRCGAEGETSAHVSWVWSFDGIQTYLFLFLFLGL